MKYLILILSLFSFYKAERYQILIRQLFFGEIICDIKIFNKGVIEEHEVNELYYYGHFENIKNLLNQKTEIKEDESNSLIFIYNRNDLKYINHFPKNKKFLIPYDFKEDIRSYNGYTIFILYDDDILYNLYELEYENYYYIQIGKKIDKKMERYLHLIIVLCIFLCSFISFKMVKVIKSNDGPNILALQYLICICSFLLIVSNAINGFFFIIFKNTEFCFIMEYTTLLIISFYKSNLKSILILILFGWGTVYFGWKRIFNKINKIIFLIDLIICFTIPVLTYFIHFTNKLYLFYIKNWLEYLIILCFIIYSITNRLIPLIKEIDYEIRTNSNLVECLKLKYNKLFIILIVIITYTLFFIISPVLDYYFINSFANNYNIYFIFQLLYESIFMLFFYMVLFWDKLPENYFDNVVFKYKTQVFLYANIYEKEKYNPSINDINEINYDNSSNELNISNLNINKLKKYSKTKKLPIILINPYVSSKSSSLFKELHYGVVVRNKNS